MQVNQTQTLTYQLQLPTAFVTTGAYVNIVTPDGTNLGDLVATALPNTLQTQQTLMYLFTPTMGGLYKVLWKVQVNGQLLTYPPKFWAVWTDIYDNVRGMLGTGSIAIPDISLDREFINLDVELHDYASALVPYRLMQTVLNPGGILYSDAYDQGMAKLIAARIRPYIGGKRPTGEVSLFKKGTTTVQYSVGSARSSYTIEDTWIEQGMRILEALIPEIYAVAVQDRFGDEVMTRGDLAPGNRHPKAPWNTNSCNSYFNRGEL